MIQPDEEKDFAAPDDLSMWALFGSEERLPFINTLSGTKDECIKISERDRGKSYDELISEGYKFVNMIFTGQANNPDKYPIK